VKRFSVVFHLWAEIDTLIFRPDSLGALSPFHAASAPLQPSRKALEARLSTGFQLCKATNIEPSACSIRLWGIRATDQLAPVPPELGNLNAPGCLHCDNVGRVHSLRNRRGFARSAMMLPVPDRQLPLARIHSLAIGKTADST